jgi:cell division protein FtsZ
MEAVRQAVTSQLLETSIEGATGILINITGGRDLSLAEIYEAVDLVRDVVDNDCNIIFGATIDENIKDEVQVTVIATGFDMLDKANQVQPQPIVQPIQPQVPTQNIFNTMPTQAQPEYVQPEPVQPEVEETDMQEMDEEDDDESAVADNSSIEDISYTSNIDLGDTSIPPFLRKLKK